MEPAHLHFSSSSRNPSIDKHSCILLSEYGEENRERKRVGPHSRGSHGSRCHEPFEDEHQSGNHTEVDVGIRSYGSAVGSMGIEGY